MATHSQIGCFPMGKSMSSRLSRKFSHRADVDEVVQDLAEGATGPSSVTLGASSGAKPEHLVVLVNGIAGSADNWKYAAEQFKKKLPDKVVVHCSSSNAALKTFNGVDVMGERLEKEVRDVIEKNPGVSKVSFVGHSLGGLISRYAIGKLYAPSGDRSPLQGISETSTTDSESERIKGDDSETAGITQSQGTIGGLEPVNFITLATPHLGCRGNQYLPFLFGYAALESLAPLISHWFIGNTGRHLFLADGDSERMPLLLRMVSDCDEGKFLSALRSFKKRTAYANTCGDRMVGWRTASIRKAAEMPAPVHEELDSEYPHIVREEDVPVVSKDFSENGSSEPKEVPASDPVEEGMVAGLQQVPWWRVDVSFLKAKSSYQAHNLIQVKTASAHSEGADVIEHIIDKHFCSEE